LLKKASIEEVCGPSRVAFLELLVGFGEGMFEGLLPGFQPEFVLSPAGYFVLALIEGIVEGFLYNGCQGCLYEWHVLLPLSISYKWALQSGAII